jgi:hypothetical protein
MQALRSDTPGPMRGSVMRLDTQYRSVYQITAVGMRKGRKFSFGTSAMEILAIIKSFKT